MSKLIKYSVTDDCIGCRACVEVAKDNFDINDNNIAFLKNQPRNEEELKLSLEALEVCPVEAIIKSNVTTTNIQPIVAKSNIKETLDKYPELKEVLIKLSPKFKRMQNPAMYNTLARFATFKEAAKLTGLSLCEILHTMNIFLGVEEKLIKNMPECITDAQNDSKLLGEAITWEEDNNRYIYNVDSMNELIQKVSELKAEENLVYISIEKPIELLRVIEGLKFEYNIKQNREFRISIFNPTKKEISVPWKERKHNFEMLDVRFMQSDPFDIIIKKSYEIVEDSGFGIIQRFEPTPLINMISEMGFDYLVEKRSEEEIWVYFYKRITEKSDDSDNSEKPDVVIQSATPVAYPVIMRLLQSEKIRKAINIKELKVWEETEKHLAWIVNGRADISFSALITSAKLRSSDVKIPAMFVWDNFYILTRGYKAKSLEDIKGKTIHTPLFEEAPPTKITQYLIKAKGLNTNDYNFVYGSPFGRPEKIFIDFVQGDADTVILREPEASYAIKTMQDRGEDISIISYNQLWNEINEDWGSFPNAGLVLKGEFTRKYPEITKVFLDELKEAIKWVTENKRKSAELSFDMMRQPVDRVELFLNRVNFNYVEGEELVDKVKQYFDVLAKENIVEAKVDEEFLNIFRM